jgi:hypothetical protein
MKKNLNHLGLRNFFELPLLSYVRFTLHILFSPQRCIFVLVRFNFQHLVSHVWMWTQVEYIWHALSSLPIWRSTNSHTWCHSRCHICSHLKEWAWCMERMVVRLYVRSFTMNWSLHDLRGPSFCCCCCSYWPNMRDNGFTFIT